MNIQQRPAPEAALALPRLRLTAARVPEMPLGKAHRTSGLVQVVTLQRPAALSHTGQVVHDSLEPALQARGSAAAHHTSTAPSNAVFFVVQPHTRL